MKKIYLGESKVAGRGIFAGENIKKGKFVVTLRGKVIYKDFRTKSDLRTGKTWISIGHTIWIEPIFPIKYINHSCDPNVGMKTARRFYALRNIKKDEELTFDYSTAEYVDFWKMKCKCGSKKCRKFVGPVQFLPKKVYESYLPYIPRYFRRLYLQYQHGRQSIRHGT